jgi:uncharacterized protein with PIN domain
MKEGHSRNEEQYFARVDADLMKEYRSTREIERSQLERASHFMRCPRCGGTLHEVAHHGVTVDRCVDCKGVWLDAGDFEHLEHALDSGVTRFFSSMFGRHP